MEKVTPSCLRHEPQLRRFANRLDRNRLRLRLHSDCDEFAEGAVVIRDNARHVLDENLSVIVPASRRFEYAFHVNACSGERWVRPDGADSWFTYEPRKHAAFETPAWVRDAVFYQIFPDRFSNGDRSTDPEGVQPWGTAPALRNFMGGDLQGILDKLDYLSDLGITAIYLTPIFQSASNHKYDTIDYFTVDPHFGDLALLRKLVDSCHARGIRVVLDAVFNHCSHLHPFFVDVREKGKKSKYWDWFHIKKWPIPDRFAKHKEALEWYECWWGFHTLPQLNYRNRKVEAYFLKVAQYWIREAGIDGWRLDVPNEVIQSFWPKFRRAVKEANPEAYIVGEIWEDATPWLQGDQFDAVMNYRFQKALLGYFAEGKLTTTEFDAALRQVMLDYPEQATAVMLNLLGSHDTARPMTACLEGVVASAPGASASDAARHAAGDGGSYSAAVESLKLMAAMQFTFEGAPCIYYGDEIGMEGGKDPDCRRCFPWGTERQSQLRGYYQKLIAIRRDNPALRGGSFRPFLVDNDRQLYGFERTLQGNRCFVILNRSADSHKVELPAKFRATELLTGTQIDGDLVLTPARKAVILRVV